MTNLANTRMFALRCAHGLKPGTCNACPATRDADTGEWSFDAQLLRGGRTLLIGGRTYRNNRHGIICMFLEGKPAETCWDGFWHWESHCKLDEQAAREYRRMVELAFEDRGIAASCSTSGYCSCPARF